MFEIKTNWISEYCKREPKERVIWDTKLYKWRDFDQKSLYEQTEELLDNVCTFLAVGNVFFSSNALNSFIFLFVEISKSAEDFVKCINKLTDNDELKISKELIKKLFSIEAEKDVARSLYMQTIHRPVVPSEFADLFECPDVSCYY